MNRTATACETFSVEPVVSISGAERCELNSFDPGTCASEAKPSAKQASSAAIPRDGLSCPGVGSSELCFIDWVSSCLNSFWSSRTGLGNFLRLSTIVPACQVVPEPISGDVWPVPLPSRLGWTAFGCKPNPRRRRRLRMHRVAWDLVRLQVGCLNWLALGCPVKPPPCACTGSAPLQPAQITVLETFERHCMHFLRAGRLNGASLGRSAEKFDLLLRMASELPSCDSVAPGDVDRMLHKFVSALQSDWGDYSRASKPKHPAADSFAQEASASSRASSRPARAGPAEASLLHNSKCAISSGLACKPVVASRVKWTLPPSFDPLPFLSDPVVKQAYIDPMFLRKPENLWPKLPKAKVHCSKSELLCLAGKWDQFYALRLFPTNMIDSHEAVGCFCVPKDDCWDRFIINPRVANSRTFSYSNFTKLLAPGSMLTLAHLPSLSHCIRFCADDLSEMYYTFKVGSQRALRNCIGIPLQPHEVSHFKAYNPSLHNCPVYASLGALAMGDSHAVEFAQQAHFNVLRQMGDCVRSEEFVSYRKVFPRGKTMEFLSIDDHMTAQVCTLSEHKAQARLRDTSIFEACDVAYPKVGLVQHPKKRRRNVTSGVFLGADVDGMDGLVCAPRHRIGVLSRLTSVIVRKGCCSSSLLSAVLGLWTHVLMFRRPLFAILQAVFADARHEPRDVVFALQRESLNELLSLCVLAPLSQSDLRVGYLPFLYAMDASPSGGGLCSTDMPPSTVQELWRFSEQRGFYTRLLGPASALLAELGLDHCVDWEFSSGLDPSLHAVLSSGESPVRTPLYRPLQEGILFDVVELFSGTGHWTLSHAALGLTAHPGVDVPNSSGRMMDFSLDSTFHELCALALRKVVREWHGGPPCLTFGTLRRPRLRSKDKPFGFNPEDPLTKLHNRLAMRTAFLFCLVALSGGYFSVEQPGSSCMFYLDCFRALIALGAVITRMCCCAFGTPYKKPLQWLHNKPWLADLARPCSCGKAKPHFIIEGTFTKASAVTFDQLCSPNAKALFGRQPRPGESVASFSASYPLSLCRLMAVGSSAAKRGCVSDMPLSAKFATLELLDPGLGLFSGSPSPEPIAARAFHDDPDWVGELADSLPFKELLRFRFAEGGHINVLETRVYKTWIKFLARRFSACRVLGLIDSRVLLGAAAKGRSSSPALSRVLRSTLPYLLGAALYPGGLHVYSDQNRSDGPSRGRKVSPPTREVPAWYLDLCHGKTQRFDLLCASCAVPRVLGRWVRLLLLLAGDVERNPGPRRAPVPRGVLDLQSGFAASTRHKMTKALGAFLTWISSTLNLDGDTVLSCSRSAALALRGFGLYLYAAGHPRYLLVYAITAVQDLYPEYRTHLTPAWQVDKKWQQSEPGECRPVISQPILEAAVALAICWGWFDWAALTLIGFLCMLHPSEMVPLVRQDIVFPEDAMSHDPVAYVHIRSPKTQRFARRQHCRLEDSLTLRFLTSLYLSLPFNARLFRGSLHTYRRQWNAIMQRLGVPHTLASKGATPGVLRGSGATFMYLETEDLPLIAWRGRWSKTKTMEFYLQEVAAQLLLQRLPLWARDRIRTLSSLSRKLVICACSSQEG